MVKILYLLFLGLIKYFKWNYLFYLALYLIDSYQLNNVLDKIQHLTEQQV